MKNEKNNKMFQELRDAGFSESELNAFLAEHKYIDNLLKTNEVVVPDGLSGRVMAAFDGSQQSSGLSNNNISHYIRNIISVAAMLLVAVSLAIYYSGQINSTGVQSNGNDTVARVEISSNPFANPSLIMDILIDRNSGNSIDGIALEAVSELWDQPNSDNENPTSIKRGDNDEIFV